MRVAMLAPIAWRVPPRHYGPWERVVSLLTEGLVARGVEVTLFATADSLTRARLVGVCPRPYSEDPSLDPKVWECLHIAAVFEQAAAFDLIHNHFDFLPLSYSGLVRTPVLTTIHGFSSERIVPVYAHYNDRASYVAISNADRHPRLTYVATVYHGIPLTEFTLRQEHGTYLLFFGRIHPDKGVAEAIAVAQRAHMPLYIAGIIQDKDYYVREVAPYLDGERVRYLGAVGPAQRDALLGGAYALLHLINFAEPFGLSMVEAMACGTPVIACGRGSVPEIVRHGETGFIVQSSDEAVAALSQVRGLHRARIRQHVADNFSQERMVDRYINVYKEILRMEAAKATPTSPTFEQRPWGSYTVLDEGHHYKVKRLEVLPGKRLSYQKHTQRTEHWMVVQGRANVTLEGQEIPVETGGTMDVPLGAAHRIANPGSETLVLIEIQRGSYLGEDDIIRLQDDYGRTPASV
jgi:glycosyltransferase involved in cell wall biosynthesis/mannose-6-phosphate isomerase-like protein (cupin superfamily)